MSTSGDSDCLTVGIAQISPVWLNRERTDIGLPGETRGLFTVVAGAKDLRPSESCERTR